MPRENPIIGSGRRGFGFEQKGFQERNLGLLLETLSKKETQKSIEALSKIDKDEWTAMATTAITLNNFISLGGASTLISSVNETIKVQINSLLSPLTNEINQKITDLLSPFINDILNPAINELTTFIATNTTGAGIGGIAGAVASLFLPGGPILIAIGAMIGAAIEEAIRDPAFEGDDRIEAFLANPNAFPFLGSDRINDFLRLTGRLSSDPIQSTRFGYQEGF